jgi:hypothetical protein
VNRFESWTLEDIRSQGQSLSWLEELRFEWLPSTQSAIGQILEARAIVLITDDEHKWFEHYILASLNKPILQRPLIPVIPLEQVYPQFHTINSETIDMVIDMLTLAYKNDFFFWYIGKGDSKRADIAKRSDRSNYLWIMDENSSFVPLSSYDETIDIKLLQLYQLFDRSLSAVLFGETNLES